MTTIEQYVNKEDVDVNRWGMIDFIYAMSRAEGAVLAVAEVHQREDFNFTYHDLDDNPFRCVKCDEEWPCSTMAQVFKALNISGENGR